MSDFKILIVEDEVFIAQDIKVTLEKIGYKVCSICYDSEKAEKELYRCSPDLVLLDITIRGQRDGIQLAEIINKYHDIPFVYLTSHSDPSTLIRAKHTRPRGYLIKPFRDSDLSSSIEVALYNHSQDFQQKNLEKSFVDQAANTPLSEKEYEIFLDIVNGLNNRQIGEKHHLSINTIKTYIKRLFDKLDVHDRVSAVRKVTNKEF